MTPSLPLPSATTTARHPHDAYNFTTLLTPSQRQLRQHVHTLAQHHIQPVINQHYESATFPFECIHALQQIGGCGLDIPAHHTHQTNLAADHKSAVSQGLIALELARFSAGLSTFYAILQPISMLSIYKCGTDAQRAKYLPAMSALHQIGAFGLTEPDAGSDASNLQCRCTPHKNEQGDSGWMLNGEKRWIGNGTIADVIIIWARNTETMQIHGFIVERTACQPNTLNTVKMENKVGVREIQNAHIYLNNVWVRDAQRLEQTHSFATGPNRTLILTRVMASWIAVGTVIGAYEACVRYLTDRKQFGVSLTSFQLQQDRLMTVLANIQSMLLMCWRVSTLYDTQQHTLGQIGLCKQHITKMCRASLSLLRESQGGNGLITDFGVARAFVDIEGIHTFEGSADVNMMIAGREFLGTAAFYVPKPVANKSKQQIDDESINHKSSKL